MLSRLCRKTSRVVAGTVLAALFALPLAIRAQDHPSNPSPAIHAAHAQETTTSTADRGDKRWATDPALRDGMRRVRQGVQALERGARGRPDAAKAADIDGAVNYMIANCQLEPDADAALHGLLAKFLVGADAARTGKNIPAALADMQAALKQYPELFDDPAWNAAAD